MDSRNNYYLVQEFGGIYTLYEFTKRAHRMIEAGQLELAEWRRTTKIIFKQMVEVVQFIHRHNVAHHDISLENFLISETDVVISDNNGRGSSKIYFVDNSIQIKLWCVILYDSIKIDFNGFGFV